MMVLDTMFGIGSLLGVRRQEWRPLFEYYVNNAEELWRDNPRHLHKLNKWMKLRHQQYGSDKQDVINAVLKGVESRADKTPEAIFLLNCGGSGSHWLQTILVELGGFVDCGEIYLPKAINRKVQRLNAIERGYFWDAIHILYARKILDDWRGIHFVNSSHQFGLKLSKLYGLPKKTVLLMRDPQAIVESRTYRKQKYKQVIAPSESESQYIDTNIKYVSRFYRKALSMKVDSKVRYEDLKSNCQQAVLNMVGELGYMEEYSAVVERAKIFDEQGQLKSGSATANHYSGPKVEVPETVRTYIEGKLSSLRKTLGYI